MINDLIKEALNSFLLLLVSLVPTVLYLMWVPTMLKENPVTCFTLFFMAPVFAFCLFNLYAVIFCIKEIIVRGKK